jgi:hypothetical protein
MSKKYARITLLYSTWAADTVRQATHRENLMRGGA